MITDDEVMRLFESADPAQAEDPAPVADAGTYLDSLRAHHEMRLLEPDGPTASAVRAGRGRTMKLATAAAAVFLAAAIAVATRDDSIDTLDQEPVTTDVPEPEVDPLATTVATDFIEAYGRFDLEEAATYLAPDADLTGLLGAVGRGASGSSPEDLQSLVSLLDAQDYRQVNRPSRCEQLGASDGLTTIACPFDFFLLGSHELGLERFDGGHFVVAVRGGRVVRASTATDLASRSADVWEPFVEWVATSRPDDLEVMYVDADHRAPRLTEASIQLWEQHVDAYVATGRSYIDRTRTICEAAPDEVPKGSELYGEAFGRALDRALVQLRAVAPPLPVRAQFESAYIVAERLADEMQGTSGPDLVDLIHELEGVPGMSACTFYGPR